MSKKNSMAVDANMKGQAAQEMRAALMARLDSEVGLRRSFTSQFISRLYGCGLGARRLLVHATRLEGGTYYSYTLRRMLLEKYGVYGGAYSYGEWTKPGAFPSGVVIGRYVSIAANVRIYLRNHPYERVSMHPFFYNRALGYVTDDTIVTSECHIEHDAWIGESAIITPGCARIGIGAVVGAGAVVTRDVPDFAIVAGNPARILKYRFSEEDQRLVLQGRWWESTVEELLPFLGALTVPVSEIPSNHVLLSGNAGMTNEM